jgi:hypothetical protein
MHIRAELVRTHRRWSSLALADQTFPAGSEPPITLLPHEFFGEPPPLTSYDEGTPKGISRGHASYAGRYMGMRHGGIGYQAFCWWGEYVRFLKQPDPRNRAHINAKRGTPFPPPVQLGCGCAWFLLVGFRRLLTYVRMSLREGVLILSIPPSGR